MSSFLFDTSVWIAHLRLPQETLVQALRQRQVLIHSAVIGELACGFLAQREQFLSDLERLPRATEASIEETRRFIEERKLYGKGLGFIDMQLISSALLSRADLMTYDKKLKAVWEKLVRR